MTLDRAAKKGTIDVTIETASVRSHDPRPDAALKGEKYFNVEKYPTMTFKSSSLMFDGDRVVGAEGELTMLGVTKPVSLKVSNFTCGDHPFNKKPMCGAEVTATIKRSEWGMTAGIPFAPADDVKIMIPVEALPGVGSSAACCSTHAAAGGHAGARIPSLSRTAPTRSSSPISRSASFAGGSRKNSALKSR